MGSKIQQNPGFPAAFYFCFRSRQSHKMPGLILCMKNLSRL